MPINRVPVIQQGVANGEVVATVSPDATISGPWFSRFGSNVEIVSAAIPFDEVNSSQLTVVSGGSSVAIKYWAEPVPIADLAPVWSLPATATVAAGSTMIASLSAVDANGDGIAWDFVNNPGDVAQVSSVGGIHELRFILPAVGSTTHTITLRPFDGSLYGVTRTIVVAVTASVYAPFTIDSVRMLTMTERLTASPSTPILTLAPATAGSLPIKYRIIEHINGPDGAQFTVNEDTGELFPAVSNPLDYENPMDSDGDNWYVAYVEFSDVAAGGTTTLVQDVTITVVDDPADNAAGGTEYFVATTGNNTNDGLSVGAPKQTIQSALALAQPGDTVWVKAGNYGAQTISTVRAGTQSAPIRIKGYQTTPGDAPKYATVADATIGTRSVWVAGSYSANSSLMPVLDAGSRENSTFGVTFSHPHVQVSGLTILRHFFGVYVNAANCRIDDIYTAEHGASTQSYSGYGVSCALNSANYLVARNVWVVNANAEGIKTAGDYNDWENCGVTCDNTSVVLGDATAGPSDYYFVVHGSHNSVRKVWLHRLVNLGHGGHGLDVKAALGKPAEHNVFDGFVVNNMHGAAIEANRFDCRYNTWRNGRINGGYGILAREGAHDNVFENIAFHPGDQTLDLIFRVINGGEESAANVSAGGGGARNNTVRNVTVNANVSRLLAFNENYSNPMQASGNIFDNWQVNGSVTTQVVLAASAGVVGPTNIIRNSTITGTVGTRTNGNNANNQIALENSSGFL